MIQQAIVCMQLQMRIEEFNLEIAKSMDPDKFLPNCGRWTCDTDDTVDSVVRSVVAFHNALLMPLRD